MGSEGAECATCEPGPHTLPETSFTTALDISAAARPRLAQGAQPGGLGAWESGGHLRGAGSPHKASFRPVSTLWIRGASTPGVSSRNISGRSHTCGHRGWSARRSRSLKQSLPPGPLLGPRGLRRPQNLPASVVTATSSQLPHRMPLPCDVENE